MFKISKKILHLFITAVFFLQSIIYPWISILPAPPPISAQESSPTEASYSTNTPAQSPLEPLLDLDTLFPDPNSLELNPPEAKPEGIPEPQHKVSKFRLRNNAVSPKDHTLSLDFITPQNTPLTYRLTGSHGEEYDLGSSPIGPIPQSLTLSLPTLSVGTYSLTITDQAGQFDTQDFSWGVLALNAEFSTYFPGDTADLALAVLDPEGVMVCDAELYLKITSPKGQIQLLSTHTGQIQIDHDVCSSFDFTLAPDYHTTLELDEAGEYQLELTAKTEQGSYTLQDKLIVDEAPHYQIKRTSATRLYPLHKYPMLITLTPSKTFSGVITEVVPADFAISSIPTDMLSFLFSLDSLPDFSLAHQDGLTHLAWEGEWQAGQTYNLGYLYDSPDLSPATYLLGPLQAGIYLEPRSWNLAIDATAGPSYAGTGANFNDGGLTAWTNPTNVVGDTTGTAATVNIGANNNNSQMLRATNYGFSIPSGATIDGVTVEVEAGSANNNRQYWNNVQLVKGGSETGDNKSDTSAVNGKAFKTFGSTSDTWNASLSPSDVNASNFGVSFQIRRTSNQATTTSIYRARITVTYTEPTTVSGNIYAAGSESTTNTTSVSVSISVNNATPITVSSQTGSYSLDVPGLTAGSVFAVYLDGHATLNATAFSVASGSNISSLNLYIAKTTIYNHNSSSTTNTHLCTTQATYPTSGDRTYSCSGTILTATSTEGSDELHVAGSYTPGANVTASKLHLVTGGTFNAGSNTLTLSGSGSGSARPLYIEAGTFTPGTGTTTFTSSSASDLENTTYYNLILNGNTTYSGLGTTVISRELLLSQGTLALGSHSLTLGSTGVTNSGSLKVASGATISQSASATTTILSSSSGTNCIGAEGASCAGTPGTIGFYNLTLGNGTTTLSTSLAGTSPTVSVANTLTIKTNATLSASGTLNVSGDWIRESSSTFTANTSTVNLTGAGGSNQTISGTNTFYTLSATTATARTIKFPSSLTTTISNSLTLQGSAGELLTLDPSTPASSWTIDPPPSSVSVSYVSVNYSTATECINAPNSNASNTTLWDTSGNSCSDPTAHSFQRKTWYDGARYWRSYLDAPNSRIRFDYSSDGSSWSENTGAQINVITSDFSVEADSSNAYLAYKDGYDLKIVKANSYPGTTFTWSTATTVYDGTSSTNFYSYPYVSRDSSGIIWVTSTHTSGSDYLFTAISSTTANDISTWNTASSLDSSTNSTKFGSLALLPSQDMYATWVDGTTIKGCLWDDDDTGGRWEDNMGVVCSAGGGDGWLSGWGNRLEITVSNTNIDTNLTHFPLLLTLGSAVGTANDDITAIFDELGTNSKKIALTKDDGTTQIYAEIETWDSTGEQAWLWVSSSALTLSSSSATTLFLYYDSSQSDNTTYVNDTNTSAAEAVWDSNFKAVHHFGSTSGTYFDSTSNNNDSTSVSVTARTANASCRVGNCPEFNGSNNTIVLTENNTLDLTNSLTIQATIDADGYGSSGEPGIVSKHWTTYEFYFDSPTTMHLYGDNAGIYGDSSSSSFTLNTPQNIAVSYNNSSVNFYTNAVAKGTNSYSGSFTTNNDGLRIGSDRDLDYPFDGHIDEIRISNTPRSLAWLKADHHSLTDNLVSWGDPESPSGGYDTIDTTTGVIEDGLSLLSDGTNLHLLYVDDETTDQISYKQYSSGTWSSAAMVSDAASNDDSFPSLTLNSTSDSLYAFWIDTSTNYIYYSSCDTTSGCDLASDWDPETAWQTTGTNVYLTSNYVGANELFALWHDGTTIAWDKINLSGNQAPNSPTSLLQLTTSDVTLSTGEWHNSTSIKFSVTASDPDSSDTLYLCVEADTLVTSFSNTEDSCGSGVPYSGSPVSVSHTLTVSDDSEYHWQVRLKDTAGAYSAWVAYGGNAESSRDFGTDTTAPTGGVVYDGTSPGVDLTYATTSLSSLSANWDSFNSDVSGLERYDYSIGTTAGATDITTWTDNGTNTSFTASSLTLNTSQIYYVNVRAVDQAGNVQSAVSSNGQLVAPSLSFNLTPASSNLGNLNPSNSYTATDETTLTTSTNAYNGYLIRGFATDYLRSLDGGFTIGDFTGGTYASPGSWVGSETGFGYTSSDSNVQGIDKFGGGTLYSPFSQIGPGDIVADHTSTVAGTPITGEQFTLTYKVKVDPSQSAHTYHTALVYTATAQY